MVRAGTGGWERGAGSAVGRPLFQEQLVIARALGNKAGIALVLHNLGYAALFQGDDVSARTFLEESLTLHRELEHRPRIASSLNNLARLAWLQGRFAEAR